MLRSVVMNKEKDGMIGLKARRNGGYGRVLLHLAMLRKINELNELNKLLLLLQKHAHI